MVARRNDIYDYLYTKTGIRTVAFLFQNAKTKPTPFDVGRNDSSDWGL